MEELRKLRFEDLRMAIEEAESLLAGGYQKRGNWSLGQVCRHLRQVQDMSVDGFPKWLSLFAFMRPVMRRLLLPRLLRGDSPVGVRTLPMLVPANDVEDAAEVAAFRDSVERLLAFTGDFPPYPALGRLSQEDMITVHATHAAHHLRFLEPNRA